MVVIERELAGRKLSWRRLPVSTAFHSPLVAAAVAPFASYLVKVELRRPRIPVYSGATGSPHGGEPAAIAQSLAEQIAQPVRFVEQIRAMAEAGATIFVEVGPGAVLTGLVGRILRDRPESIVVSGMGAHGCALGTRKGIRFFPPEPSDLPVVDTNGAGDSLAVGFLTSHVLEGRSLAESVRRGQLAARHCCSLRGTSEGLIRAEALAALLRQPAPGPELG